MVNGANSGTPVDGWDTFGATGKEPPDGIAGIDGKGMPNSGSRVSNAGVISLTSGV
jgi:hypothetical protein